MITINYLPYTSKNRTDFYKLTFYFLNKIKKENKLKIKLNILADNNAGLWQERCKSLKDINYNIQTFNGQLNYLNKIRYAISENTEYSIKLDEDVFINNHIYDYLIENIDILKDSDNLTLGVILSNNIPTIDYFVEGFLDKENQDMIKTHFLNRPMPKGLFNVDYSPLDEFTIHAKEWNYKKYYEGLSKINSELKGMHPVRISWEAQFLLNDYILDNTKDLLQKNNYSIEEIKTPYFTNTFFAIKTSEWKNIFNNIRGTFDEITLNNYKKQHNKKLLFIKNSYSIHTMYNTIFGDKNRWNIGSPKSEFKEKDFYEKLIQKIIK